MAHVTFIHGILNKPPADVLYKIWRRALAVEDGLDLNAAGVSSSFVYWADVLYAKPELRPSESGLRGLESIRESAETDPDLRWREHLSGREREFVEALASRLELDREADDSERSPGLTSEGSGEAVPLPWPVKRFSMKVLLRDAHHYLFNALHSPRGGVTFRVQEEIRERCIAALRDSDSRPHIVVSHGMGTVIAYDCLKRVAGCPMVDGLITIGSPLGLDEIQETMVPGWTKDEGFLSFHFPNLDESWVNVFDRLDPVAGFDPEIADDFLRTGEEAVKDIEEPNQGWWRHDIEDYLRGARLREELARLLRLDGRSFSRELGESVRLSDYFAAEEIVNRASEYLEAGGSYSPKMAGSDLGRLRKKRLFGPMTRFAESLLESGVADARVRRQLAQAQIDQGLVDLGLETLMGIIEDPSAEPDEIAEARGLIGRVFKQRYIDTDPAHRSEAADDLRRSISEYLSVYREQPQHHLWHGVNAASLLQRAIRDDVQIDEIAGVESIARAIVHVVEEKGNPDVWDLASAAEACIALDDYDGAIAWIRRYVADPRADVFELSSTSRQFTQVLELEKRGGADEILGLLRSQILRRGGGANIPSALESAARETKEVAVEKPVYVAFESARSSPDRPQQVRAKPALISFLIRVTDPSWEGRHVPDLRVSSRLGKILVCRGTARSIDALVDDPRVESIEHSRSAGIQDDVGPLPYIGIDSVHVEFEERGDAALIAVIDDGIDVLHETFLDSEGRSRIIAIWDQTDVNGPPPIGKSYGRYHSAEDIAYYVQSNKVPPALRCKGDIGAHGTHVTSIAAGRPVGGFEGGVAPEALIAFVIPSMKVEPGSPRSTGYSASHADGLDFFGRIADDLDLPVVVNLSQGMNAGAHDGLSLVEGAFDEFCEIGRRPGRVVVKSAGNERGMGGHAKVTLNPGSVEMLRWDSSQSQRREDLIELWFDSGDEYRFVLVDPTGERSDEVARGGEVVGSFPSGNSFKISYTPSHVDNGDGLLAVTISSGSIKTVNPGSWTLEIRRDDIKGGGVIHAWIERFAERALSFTAHEDEEMTLSVPGTARTVITVGAVQTSNGIRVLENSSYGPTRDQRRKPEVGAPGYEIRAALNGSSTGTVCRSGTSMAAPHVAGAIALLMSKRKKSGGRQLTANQIQKALCQVTKNYCGRWDRGQGYGVVNVEALLRRFVQ